MKVLFFSALLILFIIVEAQKNESPVCPPDDVISPCTCYVAGIVANLVCAGIMDQNTLVKVLEASKPYKVKGFELVESKVVSIPSSIFNSESPIKMNVMQSSLVSLFDKPAPAENNLKIVIMTGVKLVNGFQWEMFAEFKNMYFLTILNTSVKKLDKSFAKYGPKGLGMLAFYKCSVSELDDYAFAGMTNLTELYVTRGTIKELKRSMFPNPSKLEKMDFQGHRIGQLPDDLFSNMPFLTSIDLSENALAVFPETTFGSVYPNLHYLDVEANPIVCGCDIRWITVTLSKYALFKIDGICSEPEALKGKALSTLRYEDFKDCK